MHPSDSLSIVAQVAVTLAGFAGIVVVFRPESVHQWSALDKFRLRLLLTNSALPLCFSLFGMLLLTTSLPAVSVWRSCSGLVFVVDLLLLIISGNPRRIVPSAEFQAASRFMYYSISAFASGALALQVFNAVLWMRFWPFFAILFVHLIAAIVQFVRMVLLSATRE
jgi:hypothetical protein